MDTNRMIKHSLIAPAYISTFLKEYNLAPIILCEFLTSGLNDTYVITTKKGKYIYRIYRHGWRSKEAVRFEIDALNYLSERRYQASYPFAKRDGTYVTEITAPEGIRFGVLFSYSSGDRPIINPDHATLIGASLGHMHQLTESFHSAHKREFQLDLRHLLDKPAEYISPVLTTYLDKASTKQFKEVVTYLKKELDNKKLEVGFCHGDFHNHNMHIYQRKIEVFDFDCCAIGFRAYDVAVSWWNLINNYKNQEKECWEAFLTGYATKRKLAADDVDSLPLFITVRRIWLLGMMLENDGVWGTNWINKASLELFMLQIKTDHLKNI